VNNRELDTTRRFQALKTIKPRVARMLVASFLVTSSLMSYLLWSSHQDAVELAQTTTRNTAWMLSSRLEDGLRRVDVVLQRLAQDLALAPQSLVPGAKTPGLSTRLNQELESLKGVAGLQVFDASGDLRYRAGPPSAANIKASDFADFRTLRDQAEIKRVYSNVITSPFQHQPTLVVAYPVRDGKRHLLGMVSAEIDLNHLSASLQALDLGQRSVITLRRTDNFNLLLRWPAMTEQFNTPLAPGHPNRKAVEAGRKSATTDIKSQSDGIPRIFSLHVLENHPFVVSVGIAHGDMLAGWYQRLGIVLVAGGWVLLLCFSLAITLRDSGQQLLAVHEELERNAEELKDNEQRFRTLFEEAPVGHVLTRYSDGRFLASNQAFCDLTGYSKDELDHLSSWDLTPTAQMDAERQYVRQLKITGRYDPVERLILHKDGHWIPIRLQGCIVPGANGEKQILSVVESIVQQKQAEERIHLLANVFQYSGEAILITDHNNQIIEVNAAFVRMTGYTLTDVFGKDPKILASGRNSAEDYQAMWQAIKEDGRWQGELWDRSKDGRIYPKWISISTIHDSEERITHYIASFTDITRHKAAEEHIQYIAHHDTLTQLPNRFSLQSRLEQALASARRNKSHLAVMFVDLDRFKIINDTLGHQVGDSLLMEVAQRLRDSMRESDIVARLGGDEFVIALGGAAMKEAALVARKVLHALVQPYVIDGNELHSTPSIGISIYPDDGDSVEALMKNADTAMYQAKAAGRNNFQFFHPAMTETATERLLIETHLRQALAKNEFALYYQPQVDADNRVVCVEALIRWFHPEWGMMLPLKFIPVAEESGQIGAIGAWALNEALGQLKQWQAAGLGGLRMAVNISASQLRDPLLPELIQNLLQHHGLEGKDLELEITESVAMHDPAKSIGLMQQIDALGVALSIDDFGTGYTSLAHLKQLPLRQLKLDHSFVADIERDANDAAVCAATISLAHGLNLTVVAEGVETAAQRDYLRHLGCDLLQGFWFCKPLPAEQCLAFMQHNQQPQAEVGEKRAG